MSLLRRALRGVAKTRVRVTPRVRVRVGGEVRVRNCYYEKKKRKV